MSMTLSDQSILEILHSDTGMALGCTEPIAAALAVVKAREVLGKTPAHVSLRVSGNIFKNGRGVGIPGTDKRGLEVAAAMGCLTGSSDRALEVLEDVTDEIAARATDFAASGGVEISIAEGVDKLFIEATVRADGHSASATVEKHHTNIVRAERDGQAVFEAPVKELSYSQDEAGNIDGMSVARLYEFAKNVDVDHLQEIARRGGIQLGDCRCRAQKTLRLLFGQDTGRQIQFRCGPDATLDGEGGGGDRCPDVRVYAPRDDQ